MCLLSDGNEPADQEPTMHTDTLDSLLLAWARAERATHRAHDAYLAALRERPTILALHTAWSAAGDAERASLRPALTAAVAADPVVARLYEAWGTLSDARTVALRAVVAAESEVSS